MFSGIVEATGQVLSVEDRGLLKTLKILLPFSNFQIGDSIAVDGCCLTVTSIDNCTVSADLIPETLEKTTLKYLQPGAKVNIERPLSLHKGISGHLVQGHVDSVGVIESIKLLEGGGALVDISAETHLLDLLVEKGSIAVDGVSLTVIGLKDNGFSFSLIPHTRAETTLGEKKVLDKVNLEGDLIAKYMKKWAK